MSYQLVLSRSSSSSFIHTYSITIQQQKEKKEVKTELTIHWIKHNKGKACVAAKGAKLSSWLLPERLQVGGGYTVLIKKTN